MWLRYPIFFLTRCLLISAVQDKIWRKNGNYCGRIALFYSRNSTISSCQHSHLYSSNFGILPRTQTQAGVLMISVPRVRLKSIESKCKFVMHVHSRIEWEKSGKAGVISHFPFAGKQCSFLYCTAHPPTLATIGAKRGEMPAGWESWEWEEAKIQQTEEG